MSPRIEALFVLADYFGVSPFVMELPRYLGSVSGNHVFELADGRCFLVDLVTSGVSLAVGIHPLNWSNPPVIR